MKTCIFNARLAALPLALAAIFPCHVLAQTVSQLRETVVTANRVEQDLPSAPFSAIVLTGEEILASGANDANDAIRRLVGIPSRTDLRGGRNYSLDLLGFGATADQNVVVIVDGVRISENELATARLSAISPEMIESIEIIRGGSSVQWGEGASAGLINVVLKRSASAGLTGSASLQLESFSGRDARAQLQGGNAHAGFDVNLRQRESDGYRINSENKQETASAGVNGSAGAVGLRARVSSENEKSRFPGGLTFAQYAANSRQTVTPNDFGNYAETRVSAGIDYTLDAWKFALDIGQRNRQSAGYFVGSSYNSQSKSDSQQVSPKATYAGRVGSSALKVVVGLDFNRWNYNSVDNSGQNENATQDNRALYLIGDLLLPSNTRLTAGVRQEKVNKKALDAVNLVNYDRPDSLKAWDIGANQALSGGFNVYARGAQAYRLPNVDENRYLFAALRPQVTRDIEMGVKWQSVAGQRAGMRVFRQKATDEIAYDPTLFSNVNLDPTRRAGIELNGQVSLASNLTLNGSLQTVDAKFSEGPNAGKEIPLVSQTSAALRVNWQIDTRQRLGVGVQHLGKARFGNDNANDCARMIPANTLVDVRYVWKMDRVELSLAADNLTDRKSYSQAFNCVTGSIYPDPGRVLQASVKYSF
ncbi:MAG: TonB-dependent receptor [Polaromonas sp.]|nr:TonB-dependent receptor [Polaromonas sp.]